MEIIYVSLLTIKLLSHCCLRSYVNVPMGNYLYKEGAPVRQCVLCDVREGFYVDRISPQFSFMQNLL